MSTVPIWFQERFRMVPEPVLEPAGSWRPYLMRGQAPAAGPLEEHRDEITHRAVIRAAVLAVHRRLDLLGGLSGTCPDGLAAT